MNNNENNQNVNANEQQTAAPVENNEKKSWFGAGWQMIKNAAGTVTNFAKEHKKETAAVTLVTVAVSTVALVVLKKKGKVEEPAVDADGFDNK